MAAAPAARAAFLATRLTFGSRVFFVFAGVLAFVVFLVFDLVRARFEADLAFVRLTLFFTIPSLGSNRWRSALNGGPNLNAPAVPKFHSRTERLRVTGAGCGWSLRPDDQNHRRAHRPVAAVPGVAHFAPSVAPLAQTKPARTSSSPQRTLSVPVTTRIAAAGPGSPFGPAGPAGPGGPAGP
jgi:hypothetical protein